MKIEVKGVKSAQAALDRAMEDINVESGALLTVILQGISANTAPYVPVDTAALINSEVRRTVQTSDGATGSIEYGADGINPRGTPVQDYAVAVHEGPQKNWQKPGASNRFLEKGVEDFIRDDLDDILGAFK